MSLHDLRQLAQEMPYEIDWDAAPVPMAERRAETKVLVERLPVLEQMYLRVLNGESAAAAGRPTALSEDAQEQLLTEIANELVDTYGVLDAMNRYNLIMDVIKS
jgi:hypothetical protein